MYKEIISAREFAIKKHGNQKYGEHEYVYHLDQVYEIGLNANLSMEELMSIYLHDVLEDTDATEEEIIKIFGEDVCNIVKAVTGVGESRKERKNSIILKLNGYTKAINVKMCDRIANIKESKKTNERLLNMYLGEMPDYEGLFKTGKKELFSIITLLINEPKNKLKI